MHPDRKAYLVNRNVLSRRVLAGVALAALALTGCSNNAENNDAAGGETKLSGEVKVDGSSTVAPLSEAAPPSTRRGRSGRRERLRRHLRHRWRLREVLHGRDRHLRCLTPIKDAEKAACEAAGIKFRSVIVATDALNRVVSKENTWADCLT